MVATASGAATATPAPSTAAPQKGPAPAKTAGAKTAAAAPATSDQSAPTNADNIKSQAGQPAAAKGQGDGDLANAAKPEGPASPSPAPAATTHEHAGANVTVNTPIDPSNVGTQAVTSLQPQLTATTITAPAAADGPQSVVASTSPAVPLNGLALEIAVSARSGKSRFEIRLDPADLGRIDVRIDVDRNGQVTSHLTVEKPETLSLLRQDAPQLQRQLDNAGFKTGDGGLQFSLRDQSSSGQNSGDNQGRNAQRLIISEDETVPAAIAGRSYGRALGSSSGVDIRV